MAPAKYRALCWLEAEVWDLHGSECLLLEERPQSLELVRREAGAYSSLNFRSSSLM
jgi:hypothetical protein